jgi:hypothetical protein
MKYTLEDDKIVSDFMGLEFHEDKDHDVLWTGDLADETLECVAYSYDWNWLMGVVTKIESLGYGVDFYKLFGGTKDKYHVEIRLVEEDGSWAEGKYIVDYEEGPIQGCCCFY